METNNNKDKEIQDISEFVFDIQNSTKDEELYDVPFMIKYQLSDEISSTYDIHDDNILEGISN
jgi:hypothetical protein